jgi:hypothetical protein
MLRETAKYAFGLDFARFMPLNDDLTIPVPSRIIAGAGPFDFSGVTNIASVPMTVKIDNGTPETLNLDLSGAVDQSAVTATELLAAITAAGGFTDIALSIDATSDNRVKLNYDETDTVGYIQVYGEAALLAMFGQGYGNKFIKSDTIRSLGDTPVLKDEETITTTDAKGLDTEIISDGYRKGFEANVVDTAEDWALLALMEGGAYDETNEEYEVPTSEDEKVYFYVEAYYARYRRGTNKEAEMVNYVQKLLRSCKGSVGDKTHERGFADGNYTIKGTSYVDENDVMHGDTKLTQLTISEYEALDLENV